MFEEPPRGLSKTHHCSTSTFDFDFQLRLKNMGEITQKNSQMGYSAAYPTGAERCQEDGLVRRLSKRLFWDVPIESIEENTHKRFIVQRVLERGGVKDIRQLISHYSLSVVAEEAREIRSLDPVTLSFASCLINQPEESFKCYTSRQ